MIHFLQNKFLLLILTSFLFSINIPLNIEDKEWTFLHDGEIKISWIEHAGFPFCKATTVFNYPQQEIKVLLEDKENYYKIFDRVEYSHLITKDIVHIKLDMPFPFSARDYIVKYEYSKMNSTEVYKFNATNELKIKVDENYVRLIHAAGAWIISPLSDSTTELTYIWNGELRGDFPNWALNKAWIKQGNEVLTWLDNALQ